MTNDWFSKQRHSSTYLPRRNEDAEWTITQSRKTLSTLDEDENLSRKLGLNLCQVNYDKFCSFLVALMCK